MNYELILKVISERFYTQPILIIFQLLAIIIGIRYNWKNKIGKFFIFFFAFELIVQLCELSFVGNKNISNSTRKNFIAITNTLITAFEINLYYFYYKSTLIFKKVNSRLFIIPILYTIVALSQTIFMFEFSILRKIQFSYIIYTFEFVLILPPVILYFVQLIKTNYDTPLFSRPSFWISVGIFFQCIISIPCYLLISYLVKQKTVYMPLIEATLFYTPFIINTLCVIKAFLCKRTLTI